MEPEALPGWTGPSPLLGSRKLSKLMWAFVLGGLGLIATALWLVAGNSGGNKGASGASLPSSTSLPNAALGVGSQTAQAVNNPQNAPKITYADCLSIEQANNADDALNC